MRKECGSGNAEVGIWNAEFGNRIQHRVEGLGFRLQQGDAAELHAAQGLSILE